MKKLKDSSEIQEAARLFQDILPPALRTKLKGRKREPQAEPAAAPPQPRAVSSQPAAAREGMASIVSDTSYTRAPEASVTRETVPGAPGGSAEATSGAAPVYRSDRLENVLEVMCKRGGIKGAVISDSNGLPLAIYQSPVAGDIIAAFTSIAGETIVKAGQMLQEPEANNLSLDINYEDKIVLRLFTVNDKTYYILSICPQSVDERSEVELSIEQIGTILS